MCASNVTSATVVQVTTTATNSLGPVTAVCPGGDALVGGGGGYTAFPGTNNTKLFDSYPSNGTGAVVSTNPNAWTVIGNSNNATATTTTAVALCATDGPVPTEVVTASNAVSNPAGGAAISATATCPTGTVLLDGGSLATVSGGSAQGAHVIGDFPSDSLGNPLSGSASSWTVIAQNGGGSVTTLGSEALILCDTASAPGAPTIGTATAGDGSAMVAFTGPSSNGGFSITSYTATATDTTNPAHGGQTASGGSSPITVTGLTNGDTYTFTVTATNSQGTGPASAPSNAVTPKGTPTLSTNASTGVTIGGSISDSASLAGGSNPGGTVTFKLYGPSDPTCTGSVLATSTGTVGANGLPRARDHGSSPRPAKAPTTGSPPTAGTARTRCRCAGRAAATNESSARPALSPDAHHERLGPDRGRRGFRSTDTAMLHGSFGTPAASTVTFNVYASTDALCAAPLNAAPLATARTGTSGGNPTYTSASFTPAGAGSYKWVANFAGDTANVPAASMCGDASEVSVVTKATTSVSTNASGPVTVGAPIHDVATLVSPFGAPDASTVTFNVYAASDATCSSPLNAGPLATVSTGTSGGNPTYTSVTFTPAAAGSYVWVASFAGDSNNQSAAGSCSDPNETSAVVQASPAHTTNPTGPVTIGSPIHDVATLTGPFGTPDQGTVTFNVYAASDATGSSPLNASPLATVATGTSGGNPTYTSGTFTPATTGSYQWVATFAGDSNNAATAGSCSDATEVSVVQAATSGLTTAPSGPVAVGAPRSRTSRRSTTSPAHAPAASSVTFNVYSASDANCSSPLNASPLATVSTGTSGGNPTYTSDTFTPANTGSYRWVATFAGNASNTSAHGSSDSGRPTGLGRGTRPRAATISTNPSGPVAVGSSITDVATLGGTFGTPDASTVTFDVYASGDTNCSSPLNAIPLATVATGTSGGDPTYTSAVFTPAHAGTYNWVASFARPRTNSSRRRQLRRPDRNRDRPEGRDGDLDQRLRAGRDRRDDRRHRDADGRLRDTGRRHGHVQRLCRNGHELLDAARQLAARDRDDRLERREADLHLGAVHSARGRLLQVGDDLRGRHRQRHDRGILRRRRRDLERHRDHADRLDQRVGPSHHRRRHDPRHVHATLHSAFGSPAASFDERSTCTPRATPTVPWPLGA